MKLPFPVIRTLGFVGCLFLGSVSSFAQTCNDFIQPVTPDDRFELSGSEVTDLQTGLIWQRCSVGRQWNGKRCAGPELRYTWSAALALTSGNWRVPNLNELSSIVETACLNPAINPNIFPNLGSNYTYWSSSPYYSPNGGYQAWSVGFSSGNDNMNLKSSHYYVRLVRDRQ